MVGVKREALSGGEMSPEGNSTGLGLTTIPALVMIGWCERAAACSHCCEL